MSDGENNFCSDDEYWLKDFHNEKKSRLQRSFKCWGQPGFKLPSMSEICIPSYILTDTYEKESEEGRPMTHRKLEQIVPKAGFTVYDDKNRYRLGESYSAVHYFPLRPMINCPIDEEYDSIPFETSNRDVENISNNLGNLRLNQVQAPFGEGSKNIILNALRGATRDQGSLKHSLALTNKNEHVETELAAVETPESELKIDDPSLKIPTYHGSQRIYLKNTIETTEKNQLIKKKKNKPAVAPKISLEEYLNANVPSETENVRDIAERYRLSRLQELQNGCIRNQPNFTNHEDFPKLEPEKMLKPLPELEIEKNLETESAPKPDINIELPQSLTKNNGPQGTLIIENIPSEVERSEIENFIESIGKVSDYSLTAVGDTLRAKIMLEADLEWVADCINCSYPFEFLDMQPLVCYVSDEVM